MSLQNGVTIYLKVLANTEKSLLIYECFFDIISNVIDEECYYESLKILEYLRKKFYRLDIKLNSIATGTIPNTEVVPVLRECWPKKTEAEIEELYSALVLDQPEKIVSYKWVFESEHDSLFYNVVREMVFQETDDYIEGLSSVIEDLFSKNGSFTEFSKVQFRNGIKVFDKSKTSDDVEALVSRGYGNCLTDTLSLSTFLSNLQRRPCFMG